MLSEKESDIKLLLRLCRESRQAHMHIKSTLSCRYSAVKSRTKSAQQDQPGNAINLSIVASASSVKRVRSELWLTTVLRMALKFAE